MKEKRPIDLEAFWQSKYEYYRNIILWIVVASSVASVFYYASDCYLLGKFSTVTLIPRMAIMVPLLIYIMLNKMCQSYKVMVPMAYIVAHCVMWCTIWACMHLNNLDYAAEGFFIINYIFMAIGIAAPMHMAVMAHGLLFLDIIIANAFLVPYPEFRMMLLLGVPSYVAICVYNLASDISFKDRFFLRLQMEESAIRDSLTGVYNRKVMAKLVDENKKFINTENDISIIMFDLDYFKKVNDTYGHDVGDQVLVGICQYIPTLLAEEDILIRWGGEEFIIVVNRNLEKTSEVAEQIRKGIEENEKLPIKVTVSMGVAQYKKDNYEHTVKAADEALYRAKGLGRNRVELEK